MTKQEQDYLEFFVRTYDRLEKPKLKESQLKEIIDYVNLLIEHK